MILCDLVSVLARSWYLDGTWPVGVNIAEAISQILKGSFRNVFGLIQAYKEMNWSNTSLSSLLRYQEEVKALIALAILDKVCINDWPWLRVLNSAALTLNEHSLVDSFVDDHKWNWWWSWYLVIERSESCFKLRDLLFDDLVSHLLSNSISEDQKLVWWVTLMLIFECLDGIFDASI